MKRTDFSRLIRYREARRFYYPGIEGVAVLANTAGEARAWFKKYLHVKKLPIGFKLIAERV